MTRDEVMRSFVTGYSMAGSRIGHKSIRTPTDHAVLPRHEEAACGVKVIVVLAATDASPFDPDAPFSCTRCKGMLKHFPPPDAIAAGIAANKKRSENTQRANDLIEAVGAMFRRHDARAKATNHTRCGCEDCIALRAAAGIEGGK